MLNKQKQLDLKYGLPREEKVYQKLSKRWGHIIKMDRYNKYDFQVGTNRFIELKSRRTCKDAFPTTIIGMNKTPLNGEKVYFMFNFVDGLYYIKYNKELFDSFETRKFRIIKRDIFTNNYCIPIDKLKKFKG